MVWLFTDGYSYNVAQTVLETEGSPSLVEINNYFGRDKSPPWILNGWWPPYFIFTHLKLYLDTATQNFRWFKIKK